MIDLSFMLIRSASRRIDWNGLLAHLDNFDKESKTNSPVWKRASGEEVEIWFYENPDTWFAKLKFFFFKYSKLFDNFSIRYLSELLCLLKMFGTRSEMRLIFPRMCTSSVIIWHRKFCKVPRTSLALISRNYAASIRKPRCAWWNPATAGSLSREKVDW